MKRLKIMTYLEVCKDGHAISEKIVGVREQILHFCGHWTWNDKESNYCQFCGINLKEMEK